MDTRITRPKQATQLALVQSKEELTNLIIDQYLVDYNYQQTALTVAEFSIATCIDIEVIRKRIRKTFFKVTSLLDPEQIKEHAERTYKTLLDMSISDRIKIENLNKALSDNLLEPDISSKQKEELIRSYISSLNLLLKSTSQLQSTLSVLANKQTIIINNTLPQNKEEYITIEEAQKLFLQQPVELKLPEIQNLPTVKKTPTIDSSVKKEQFQLHLALLDDTLKEIEEANNY